MDNNKVTSPRPGFAPVTLELLLDKRIEDPTTVAVYAALSSFANYDTADCFPSHVKIGERARCDERTVRRHIDELARLGYLEKIARPGFSNIYHLADPWGRKAPEGSDASVQTPGEGRTPVTRGVDMDDQGGRTPVTDEREGENEKKKREGKDSSSDRVLSSSLAVADAPAAPPPSLSLLEEIRKAAGEEKIRTAFMSARWIEDLKKRGREASAESVLRAFRVCLTNQPDKVRFFCEDFSKWLKIANDQRLAEEKKKSVAVPRSSGLASGYATDAEIVAALGEAHGAAWYQKPGGPPMAKTA